MNFLSRHQSDATKTVPIPEVVPISSSIDERKPMINDHDAISSY